MKWMTYGIRQKNRKIDLNKKKIPQKEGFFNKR